MAGGRASQKQAWSQQALHNPRPPPALLPAVTCLLDFNRLSVHSRAQLAALAAGARMATAERRFTYGPGSIFGELDFLLQRPRRWEAGRRRWCGANNSVWEPLSR